MLSDDTENVMGVGGGEGAPPAAAEQKKKKPVAAPVDVPKAPLPLPCALC